MEKMKEKNSDCVIWHRKLRDFFKKFTEEFRKDYGLGQIDLDILLFDDLQISTPRLTIPHPRMKQRQFVMVPLEDALGKLQRKDAKS